MTKLEAWLEKVKDTDGGSYTGSLEGDQAIAVIEKLKSALETYQAIPGFSKTYDTDDADEALAIDPNDLNSGSE